MEKVLIVKYGETALRGGNKHLFEKKIVETIKKKVITVGDYYVVKEPGRLVVEYNGIGEFDYERVIPLVLTTLGIVGVAPCLRLEDDSIQNINECTLAHMQEHYKDKNITFKIDTRRANKNYPLDSVQISTEVGAYILDNMNGVTVNVRSPEVRVNVEIRNKAYIFSKMIKGYGGLPVGTSGKGMVLLSGGIDSPVAGFMLAKRGVEIEAVYFHSPPYTSERAKDKVIELAKQLSIFSNGIKLHVVPFTEVQLYLKDRTQDEKLTIFLKRAMLKIADKIAQANDCYCLITGDSVGQVASQTLHSLKAVESSCELPIIRPLSGMDKQEIVDIGIKIKTYEISILPYEDCCTIFVAKHPETKPKASIIERIESSLFELDELINKAIIEVETIQL
jgi:tRNA uracil 4-sulfurtransferase